MTKTLSNVRKCAHSYLWLVVLCLFFGLSYGAAHGVHLGSYRTYPESITYDEVAHIGSAQQYWHDKQILINHEHPAFVKIIAGVPLQFMNLKPSHYSHSDLINSREGLQWHYGKDFIFTQNPTRTNQIVSATRTAVLILNTALLGLLFWALRAILNKRVAVVAIALIAFNPTILAHASLVTFDVPALLTIGLAAATLIKYFADRSTFNAVVAGLALGLALVSKFSAVAFIPYAVLLFIVLYIYAVYKRKRPSFKMHSIGLLVYILAASLLILTVYIPFTYGTSNHDALHQINSNWIGHLSQIQGNILTFLVNLSSITKAAAIWIDGVLITSFEVSTGRLGTYFTGHIYHGGLILPYFPTLILTKTPIATLVLMLASLTVYIKNLSKKSFKHKNILATIPLTYAVLYLAYAMDAKFKLGVRHMFPVIASLIIFVAVVLQNNVNLKLPIAKIRLMTLAYVCVIISFLTSLFAFPHYLSYYNLIGGGTNNGYKIATDSNYDWGEDFISLQQWQIAHPNVKLYYNVFAAYGVIDHYLGKVNKVSWYNNNLPAGSYIAVSSNNLAGDQASHHIKYQDIFKTPPIRPAPSIFIFVK